MTPPFETLNNADEITILISKQLRDLPFAAEFGAIQRLGGKSATWEQTNTVCINFSKCEWADPLPLIHIGLLLHEISLNHPHIITKIVLPNTPNGFRLLKFLADEGFIEMFLSSKTSIIHSENPVTHENIRPFSELSDSLAYCNCRAITARIINVAKEDFNLPLWITETGNILEREIVGHCPPWEAEHLIHKATYMLRETIQNVIDHAYESFDTPEKNVGIYARFRTGLKGSSGIKNSIVLWAAQNERNHCLLDPDFLRDRDGCLEVFIVDIGIGIVESLKYSGRLENKYKFPEACEQIFLHGKRRKTTGQSSSQAGGLGMLHALLGDSADYLRGIENDTWIHGKAPFVSLGKNPAAASWWRSAYGITKSGCAMRGLSWTFRLSWNMSEDRQQEEGWKSYTGNMETHPLLANSSFTSENREKLSRHCNQRSGPQLIVFDCRFIEDLDPRDFLKREISQATECIVFYPPAFIEKNSITKFISEVYTEANTKGIKNLDLLICDIPSVEESTFQRTLERASFVLPESSIDIVGSITIASRRLLVTKFSAESIGAQAGTSDAVRLRLLRDDFKTKQFLSAGTASVDYPSKSYLDLIRFLIYWDSNIYWKHLGMLFEKLNWTPYVDEEIIWGDITIHGYFDFSQTFHDAKLLKLYRISLERLQGVSPKARLIAGDPLVRTLVERHNSRRTPFVLDENYDSPLISVGSVRVTGTSNNPAIRYPEHIPLGAPSYVISFFNHGSSDYRDNESLLLWPKDEWLRKIAVSNNHGLSSLNGISRIGKTPAVARGGADYFRLPRNSKSGQSSEESYTVWQASTPCIAKIGHWVYQGNHDLVTLNLWNCLKIHGIAKAETGVARYMLAGILSAIEGSFETFNRKEYPIAEAIERLHSKSEKTNVRGSCAVAAVVYNSHPTTDFLIQMLLRDLPIEHARKLVAFRQLRDVRSNSSLLVSPLAVDRLDELLDGQETPTVIFVDDAEISGKTFADMEGIIKTIASPKVVQVWRLTIVDRKRLPWSDENSSHQAFWRYDVPILDNHDSCPLCRALDNIEAFASTIINPNILTEIITSWRAVSPISHWTVRGLDPVPLDLDTKYFDYPRVAHGEPDIKVRIMNSVGVAIYLSELHAMTFHDDLILDILDIESIAVNTAAVIQIVGSQLLLYSTEFSGELRIKLLLRIAVAMLEYRVDLYGMTDKNLEFGFLVLLSQPQSVLSQLSTRLVNCIVIDRWRPDAPWGDRVSDLVQVAISYLIFHCSPKPDFPPVVTHSCLRYLNPDVRSAAHVYEVIFREIFDDDGYIHRKPLPKIFRISSRKQLAEVEAYNCALREGSLSAMRIGHVLDKVDSTDFRASAFGGKEALKLITESKGLIEESVSVFQECLGEQEPSWDGLRGLKEIIMLLTERLEELLQLAYIPGSGSSCESSYDLSSALTNLAERIRVQTPWAGGITKKNLKRVFEKDSESGLELPRFRISSTVCPELVEKHKDYFLWDALTTGVVEHLLTNVVHSNHLISDPWGEGDGQADMWLKIVQESSHVMITFANGYDSSNIGNGWRLPESLTKSAESVGVLLRYNPDGCIWYSHLALSGAGRLGEFEENAILNIQKQIGDKQ